MAPTGLGPCIVCGQPGQAQCSRCHAVDYCGADCQRNDWKSHKAVCGKSSHQQAASAAKASTTIAQANGSTASVKSAPSVSKAEPADPAAASTGAAPTFVRQPNTTRMSYTGEPGAPEPYHVILDGQRSTTNAQRVVDKLRECGCCVIKAGAEKSFQKGLFVESRVLWDSGQFMEAKKGAPVSYGSSQVKFDSRDDKVCWFTNEFVDKHDKRLTFLKTLDSQLNSFGFGLKVLLEEQLGIDIKKRTPSMLACYAGDKVPGARYDFHVDNPYMTSMQVPDDKRRLTLIYYISDGEWDVKKKMAEHSSCAFPTLANLPKQHRRRWKVRR